MGDRVLNRLEMALNGIVIVWYVIDILYYTIIGCSWGFGVGKSKKCDKQNTFIVRVGQRIYFIIL